MNAKELFDLAPFGAVIAFSNGQPKPPARHKNKLREWESRNSTGRFVERNPKAASEYSREDGFVLLDARHVWVQIMCRYGVESSKSMFEIVRRPPAGSILAFSAYTKAPSEHLEKVYDNEEAATLASRNGPRRLYKRVEADGSLTEWKLPVRETVDA